MIDKKIFQERFREVAGGNPKSFAQGVGISLSSVYNYLDGRIPQADILFRIARYTERPMEWFLTEDAELEQAANE